MKKADISKYEKVRMRNGQTYSNGMGLIDEGDARWEGKKIKREMFECSRHTHAPSPPTCTISNLTLSSTDGLRARVDAFV